MSNYDDSDDSDPDALPPLPPGCPLEERRAPENRDQELRQAFANGKRFQSRRFIKRWGITVGTLIAAATTAWQTGLVKPGSATEPSVSAHTIDQRLERLETKFEAMERAFTVRSTQNDANLSEWRRDQNEYRAARDKQEERMNLILRRLDVISLKLGVQVGQGASGYDSGVTVYATPTGAETRR